MWALRAERRTGASRAAFGAARVARGAWLRALIAIGIAPVTFACGRDGGGGAPVRAGEPSAAREPQAASAPSVVWTVSDAPVVDIGAEGQGPTHELYQVRGAYRLSDGRLVVANAGSRELRFYGETGEYLGAAGRRGEGPGEFRWIDSLFVVADDSLVVVENTRGPLLTVFDREGTYRRSFRLDTDRFHWVVGVFSTGEVVALRGGGIRQLAPGEALPEGEQLSLASFRSDGSPRGTLVQLPVSVSYRKKYGRVDIGLPAPFHPEPWWSVRGGWLAAGYSDRYEIGIYDPEGRRLRTVSRERVAEPVIGRSVAQYRAMYGRWESPEAARLLEEILDQAALPEHLPAFGRVWLDDLGMLWVQDYTVDPATDPGDWTVFDRAGRAVARVRLPARFRITHIDEGFVTGVLWDSLDVEHVVVHRLTRRSR